MRRSQIIASEAYKAAMRLRTRFPRLDFTDGECAEIGQMIGKAIEQAVALIEAEQE